MKLMFHYGDGVLTLPAKIASFIDTASPLALSLLLRLAAEPGLREATPALLAERMAASVDDVKEALAFWQKTGLLDDASGCETGDEPIGQTDTSGKKPKEQRPSSPKSPRVVSDVSVKTADNGARVTVVSGEGMPNYTGKEIEALMQGDPALALLIDECQKIAGKLFNVREINQVLGLADYLRLDSDYILLLFHYCCKRGKNSVPYIAKTAYALVNNDEITTYAQLEVYVASLEKVHTLEQTVRRLAGLGSRTLTAREKKILSSWASFSPSEELISLAYETTVNNTGKFVFAYMDKVLTAWHEAGCLTAQDVTAAAELRAREASGQNKSFDLDEFFKAAVKKSYGDN